MALNCVYWRRVSSLKPVPLHWPSAVATAPPEFLAAAQLSGAQPAVLQFLGPIRCCTLELQGSLCRREPESCPFTTEKCTFSLVGLFLPAWHVAPTLV